MENTKFKREFAENLKRKH